MEKMIDCIVMWLMKMKWKKRHSATIENDEFIVRMFSRDYYENNIE